MHRIGLVGAVFCIFPATASAVPSTSSAPALRISGYTISDSSRQVVPEQADWVIVRTGAPKTDLSTWLPPSDPAFARMNKNHGIYANAEVTIRFSEDGSPEFCNVTKSEGAAVLIDGLCKRLLPNARLIPAITRGGQRQWDVLKIAMTFNPTAQGRSKIIPVIPPVMAPPQSSPNPSAIRGLPLFTAGPAAVPNDAPRTQVSVQINGGQPYDCKGSWFSRTPSLDRRACDLALRASYGDKSYNAASLQILFVGDDLRALLTNNSEPTHARPKEGLRNKLLSVARETGGNFNSVELQVEVGPDGRASDCWLSHTSGSDRADLAICNELLRHPWLKAGRDMFGVTTSSHIYDLEDEIKPRPAAVVAGGPG